MWENPQWSTDGDMKINKKKAYLKFFKRFRFKSILFKNFIFYTVIVMIPILFFAVFYYNDMKNTTYDEINSASINNLNSMCDTTDAIIFEMQQFVNKTASDDSTKIFMISKNSDFNNQKLWEKLKQNNLRFKSIYGYIDSIYIYSETTDGIICNNDYMKTDSLNDRSWLTQYQNASDDNMQTFIRNKNNYYPTVITILKPVMFSGRFVGAVAVNIDIRQLTTLKSFEKNSDGSYNLLISGNGKIFYSKNQNLINQTTSELSAADILKTKNPINVKADNKDYIFFSQKSQKSDMYYALLHPISDYKEKNADTIKKAFLFAVTVFICGILAAVGMTYYSIRPINNIIDFIDSTNFEESLGAANSKDELNYIIEYARELMRAKNEADNKLSNNTLNLKKAYNLALQSQINPHFLSNTLETINWKSIQLNGGNNDVSKMIGKLGKIYNYLLKSNEYLVTIKEELTYTELYAEILSYRYKNRFEINWNIDEEILEHKIIKLSLQPILENAVYHGVKPVKRRGKIIFEGGFSGDDIYFKITDNGAGIPHDRLIKIREDLKNAFDIFDEHIGITNVNQRIKMVYKDKYGITIDSEEGKGTCVTVLIPKEM